MRFEIPARTEFPEEYSAFYGENPKIFSNHPLSILTYSLTIFSISILAGYEYMSRKKTESKASLFFRFDQIVWPSLLGGSSLIRPRLFLLTDICSPVRSSEALISVGIKRIWGPARTRDHLELIGESVIRL